MPTFESGEVQRKITLGRVESVPDGFPVAIDTELINGTVTGENPARVKITVINTANSKQYLPQNEGQCAIFDRYDGASEPPGLNLHRPGFPGFAQDCRDPSRTRNLWRMDLPTDATCAVLAYGCPTVSYNAGESRSETYRVWDNFAAEGYMQPGTYRFSTTLTVGDLGAAEEFTWGFSLIVEHPG